MVNFLIYWFFNKNSWHKMVGKCKKKIWEKKYFFWTHSFAWPHHNLYTEENLNFEKTVKIYKYNIKRASIAGICVVFLDISSIFDISCYPECVWKQILKSWNFLPEPKKINGETLEILHVDMTFSKKLPRVSNGFEIWCGE
jgi:hypothetical protein